VRDHSLATPLLTKGELKSITTRSCLVLDGPSVLMPLPFINPDEDERAEETLTDLELTEYTIKIPPHLVQKAKPILLRNYVEMDSVLEDSVDECNLADPNNDLVDTIPEMFTNEHTLDYKIKESKLLIDELDPPRSSDFLPSPEYDLVLYEDFSEDFNPPLYELPFHKEVLRSETLLSFSSENEEKVFNPEILTSKGVHTSLLLELSHRGPKAFKFIKNFESPMEIFPCSYGEDICILDVPCLHFYPP
nr:hypothetical protein [Tanacetum cinerariifolium]